MDQDDRRFLLAFFSHCAGRSRRFAIGHQSISHMLTHLFFFWLVVYAGIYIVAKCKFDKQLENILTAISDGAGLVRDVMQLIGTKLFKAFEYTPVAVLRMPTFTFARLRSGRRAITSCIAPAIHCPSECDRTEENA